MSLPIVNTQVTCPLRSCSATKRTWWQAGYSVRLHGRNKKSVPAPITLTLGDGRKPPSWIGDVDVVILTVRDAIPKAYLLATAEFATIRLRLLKLGTRVIETASRIRLAFAAACPEARLIRHIAAGLMPSAP